MRQFGQVVIFGGTGFIGTHLAQHLLSEKLAKTIVLADMAPPREEETYCTVLRHGLASGQVRFVKCDARQQIGGDLLSLQPSLIANLAAVHREPGHEPREYFETNLKGAENVCRYASETRCNRIVFTSSISPYGPSEDAKNEDSLPVPETAYGSSKLAAEKIHQGWQIADRDRKLLILRPGVVFGPGEGGNVTRLVRSVVRGYFVYMGNRHTRKAAGYVKELCSVILFGLDHQDRRNQNFTLLNFSMDPPPTVEAFVNAIRGVTGIRRSPMSVPRSLLLGVSYPIDLFARIFGIKQPISPVRVRKLFRSTYIEPLVLRQLGYEWSFTIEEAFQDWMRELPSDFLPNRDSRPLDRLEARKSDA
jgi:GlcNAc-P-P-Und epimerase